MTTQLGLFDVPPYQAHSDTSRAAALSLSESRRATLRAAVLR